MKKKLITKLIIITLITSCHHSINASMSCQNSNEAIDELIVLFRRLSITPKKEKKPQRKKYIATAHHNPSPIRTLKGSTSQRGICGCVVTCKVRLFATGKMKINAHIEAYGAYTKVFSLGFLFSEDDEFLIHEAITDYIRVEGYQNKTIAKTIKIPASQAKKIQKVFVVRRYPKNKEANKPSKTYI